MKLIKLELRRNNLKPYLWGSLGIFIFAVTAGIVLIALPLIDPGDSTGKMMSDFTMLSSLVSVIVMSCYAILGTIMHIKFIVEEYTGRKNVLLFTYPQKRSQILLAKFILTFVFTIGNLRQGNHDSFNTSENRGRDVSHGLNHQKLGKELLHLMVKSSVAQNKSNRDTIQLDFLQRACKVA